MTVQLKDGRRLTKRFREPLGSPKRPPSKEAIWTKFADCTGGALSAADQRRTFDMLQNADGLARVGDLPEAAG